MESATEKPVLKCENMVVSMRGFTETDGKKVVIFVPANEIDRIILKFGRPEHRPLVSLTIGIICALIGLFGLLEIFWATRVWRYEIGMMVLGVIGVSLIFDTLKQRYFLEVHKKNGTSRLVFSRKAQKDALENFCREVKTVYRVDIANDTLA